MQVDQADRRLTGKFSPRERPGVSDLDLTPITISAGSFDVDFVDG